MGRAEENENEEYLYCDAGQHLYSDVQLIDSETGTHRMYGVVQPSPQNRLVKTHSRTGTVLMKHDSAAAIANHPD